MQLVTQVLGKIHTLQEITEGLKCLGVFMSKYMHTRKRETKNQTLNNSKQTEVTREEVGRRMDEIAEGN